MSRPTPSDSDTASAVRGAAVVFGAMIAFQMAGKATQNALFLSTFDIRQLPSATIAAAALTIFAVLIASRMMSRFGPMRVVSAAFLASGMLQLLEWALFTAQPTVATVAIYLHYSALGALLISGYWSILNERFDPRTMKRAVGPIGMAGAVGGLAGGLTAFSSASLLPVSAILPVLASLHIFCGIALRRVGGGFTAPPTPPATSAARHAFRSLTTTPYMRTLIAVVLLATVAEGLLDFVFKAQARAALGGDAELLRLFALFYMSAGVLSFLVQTGLSHRALEQLGLARTAGALPLTIVLGSATAIALPGLTSALFARGAEMVARNTLYRSAYELLFTPMRAADKRAMKPLVDVGVVRLGDAIAAGLVVIVLTIPGGALPWILALAIGVAAAGIALTVRLHAGYVNTLERSLVSRAVQLDMDEVTDSTTRATLMRTIAGIARVGTPERPSAAVTLRPLHDAGKDAPEPRIERLRSRDAARVRAALAEGPLDSSMVPVVIGLAAWDEVAPAALEALQGVAVANVGPLVAALLDPDEEFTVRRRIPSVLTKTSSPEAVRGLTEGLRDARFEVRFRCGRALARILSENSSLVVADERIHAAVLREVAVERPVWESQRLLDRADEEDVQAGFVDDVVRDRASRSLEHVFTLLSLVMPPHPLRIAFRGLYADDPQLRGTALEYLEVAMPAAVRDKLWPFLDDRPRHPRPTSRPREEVIAALLASSDYIARDLETSRGNPPRR